MFNPIRINDSTIINSQILLAPMAGVTDVIFRSLVREWAPDSLICTEMISSNGLVYSKRWDAQILDKSLEDHPISYQLAAHKPEVVEEAATNIVMKHRPDLIDLNMGCPVKKITGNFEGCALMQDPDLAAKLIETVVKAVDVPVSVKFRLGWNDDTINYKEFGQMAEAAGASMVTLHARTRAQGYRPGVKWDAFGELKQAVSIPVIANGDIVSIEDVRHVLSTYGVDGVMIGRGCQGEPWKIGALDQALKTGSSVDEATLQLRLDTALRHVKQMITYKGEQHGVREMRGQLPWYVKGFRGASSFRGQLTSVSSLSEVEALFEQITAAQNPELAVA